MRDTDLITAATKDRDHSRQTSATPKAHPMPFRAIPQSKGGAFGSWEQAGMALITHALLSHQSQRRQLEFRIIGVNSARISVPSNTAAVVL